MAHRDANGVPILALNNSSQEFVQGKHLAALDPKSDEQLLTGATVLVHNKRPINSPDEPDVTVFTIGGETLDEAAKSVVGGFEFHAHLEAPDWVASTDDDLANILAEHFACKVKDISSKGGPKV